MYESIADRLHENIDYKIYSHDRDFVDYNEEYLSTLDRFFTSKTQDEQKEFNDMIREFFRSDNPLIHRECEELHEFVARDFVPYFQTKEIIKDMIIKNRYPQYEDEQRKKVISIDKLK